MSSKNVDLTITSGRERPRDIIARAEALSFNLAFNPGGFLGGGSSGRGSPLDCPDCLSDCIDLTLDEYLAGGSNKPVGYITGEADLNGDVYEMSIPVREIDAVWFDDLPALRFQHWNIAENNAVDPVEDLLPGTVVKVRFLP